MNFFYEKMVKNVWYKLEIINRADLLLILRTFKTFKDKEITLTK